MGIQIATHIAPIVVELTDRIVAFTTKSGGMGEIVGKAFKKIAGAIAITADILTGIKAAFNAVRAVILYGIGRTIKNLDALARTIVSVWNLLPGIEITVSESFGGLADELISESKRIGDEAFKGFDAAFSGTSSGAVRSGDVIQWPRI
jgi:hypothetical protein